MTVIGGAQAGTYYCHRDGIGSVRGLTDSSQTLVNKYAYTAFGEPHAAGTSETVPQRYTFQGREASGTGAPMFYRNRRFDPATGRAGAGATTAP